MYSPDFMLFKLLHAQYVQLAEEVLACAVIATVPGAYLVDSIPVLKILPVWVPGVRGWRREAAERKAQALHFINKPFESVKTNMVWRIPKCPRFHH